MASAGVITVSGSITSLPQGAWTVGPFTITPNTSGNYVQTEITLASGNNTITVPSWTVFMAIVPPSSNTQTLTLKGITGDTGFQIAETVPTFLSFQASAAPSTLVITAGGATSSPTNIIFT